MNNKHGKKQRHVDDDDVPHLPRTTAHSATCASNKCTVVVTLLMCLLTGEWYLSNKGNLEHILHVQRHAIYEPISEKDLDESETNLMNIMFRQEMKPSVIGRIMDSLREQKGLHGRFRSKTVYNTAQRHSDAIDLARGIDKKWSNAKVTIAQLEAIGVSYYALMMDKNDNVFAQKCKGRPSLRQSEEIRMHGELRSELRQLRKDMSMENGAELLLSLSIATDEMQRAVHMFPEVFYMDVISNTNRQKRDLFVLVLKDASGETNIGNASVLPCGKNWIFSMVYQHFLRFLYGKTTLSRLRLALTDDDTAAHSAFDAATKIVKELSSAKHMLCVFHAIVMRFQDLVYGFLPKKKGGRELTSNGEIYGEVLLFNLLFCRSFN